MKTKKKEGVVVRECGLEGSQAVPARPSEMGNVYNHFF
jgi:hypothetical protein